MENRAGLIADCRLAQATLNDTGAIDAELAELYRELEAVTELSRKAINENARTAVDQVEFRVRTDGYLERRRKATARRDRPELCVNLQAVVE